MDYAERAGRRRLAVFLDPKKNYAERPRRTGLAVFWLVFISFGVIVIFGSQQKN